MRGTVACCAASRGADQDETKADGVQVSVRGIKGPTSGRSMVCVAYGRSGAVRYDLFRDLLCSGEHDLKWG